MDMNLFFSEDFFRKIFKDIEESSLKRDKTLWCLTRDVFQTRVDEYARESKNYLGAAVVGEIGNNTFDHNWNFVARYPRGTYLKFERQQNMVILADFGRGVRESLKVVFDARDDEDAVKAAFTQRISGRAAEQRGNGLKFVLESVVSKKWSMYYQSGTGCCIVDKGDIIFTISDLKVPGCFAILFFEGVRDET